MSGGPDRKYKNIEGYHNNNAHTNGRQLKYTDEIRKSLLKFFCTAPEEIIDEIPHSKNGEVTWTEKRRNPANLPTVVQFCKEKNIPLGTMYGWLDENKPQYQKALKETLRICQEYQTDFLMQAGLKGLYNPIFAKFVAINRTDMKDKAVTDNNVTVKITPPELDEEDEINNRTLDNL